MTTDHFEPGMELHPAPTSWAGWLAQPFMPPFRTARHYNLHKFRKDIIAGLTVSVVEVPQAMAYAIVAGVPPVYGIYTSIIQGIIGALLSSSEHMTTGPTNTQSLLIASAVHRMASSTTQPELYLQLVFSLTMLKGLIQLAFAAARMGSLVRAMSRSVISGLVSGAGLLIFFQQLPAFFGVHSRADHEWPGCIGPIHRLWLHIDEVNIFALGIAIFSLLVILCVRAISKLLPGALLAIVLSAMTVWILRWTPADLPLVDRLPPSLPHFHVPPLTWERSEALFGGALALAVIGMLESVSIARSIAAKTGEKISADQEFFAQGLKNFISSFFQCIPGSGSFTRSALDYAAGAATRFAAVFNGCFVAVLFLAFGREAQLIPRASLAAVLFVIAFGLVDWEYILRMIRSSRPDALVCVITLLATLFIPLEYAIFVGVVLNIGLYLKRAGQLHMSEMIHTPGGPFIERPVVDRQGNSRVLFLQLEGQLFFGLADELREQLTSVAHSEVRVIILRLKRTHSMDGTVLVVLEQFVRDMRPTGRHVILCGIRPELMTTLQGYGLVDLIGKQNIFASGYGVFTSAKQALQRAQELVGASLDVEQFAANVQEPLDYEI